MPSIVDPIRAKMAETPEASEYTSAKTRIESAKAGDTPTHPNQSGKLLPFVGYPREDMPAGLPFRLQDYLELLDWRQVRRNKRGAIDDALPPILERLSIEPDKWLYTSSHFENSFENMVSTAQSMLSKCKLWGTNEHHSSPVGCC